MLYLERQTQNCMLFMLTVGVRWMDIPKMLVVIMRIYQVWQLIQVQVMRMLLMIITMTAKSQKYTNWIY